MNPTEKGDKLKLGIGIVPPFINTVHHKALPQAIQKCFQGGTISMPMGKDVDYW